MASPFISLTAGAHSFGDFGLDGTFNLTFDPNENLSLYTGLDLDIVFAEAKTVVPLWIPIGLSFRYNRRFDVLAEFSIGLNDYAQNLFGGGARYYF